MILWIYVLVCLPQLEWKLHGSGTFLCFVHIVISRSWNRAWFIGRAQYMFVGWMKEMERANEMKTLWSLRQEIFLLLLKKLLAKFFSTESSQRQDVYLQRFIWVDLWEIQCHNALLCSGSLHNVPFCKNRMGCGHKMYDLITHHSLAPLLPTRSSNTLTLQCLI